MRPWHQVPKLPTPARNRPKAPARKVHVSIPIRKKTKHQSPTPSDEGDDSDKKGEEGDEDGDEDDEDEHEGKAGSGGDDETEGDGSADESSSFKPSKGKNKGGKSRGKKATNAKGGASAPAGLKGSKGKGLGKGSKTQARNLKGSGFSYDPPCDSCYLKPTFCERPVSGSGNCIPCKVKKLSCVYHLTPEQIGLLTKKESNSKNRGRLSLGGKKKIQRTASRGKRRCR